MASETTTAAPSRTERGWVVVNSGGWPLWYTATFRRGDAIRLYGGDDDGSSYRWARRKLGARVRRCTLTVEAPDAAG